MQEVSLQHAGKEYVNWRRSQGYANATIKNDKTALNIAMRALGTDFLVCNVAIDQALTILENASRTRSGSSVNMIHSSLSAFFRWCRMRGLMPVDQDPLMGIRYRRVPKKERKRLDVSEFGAFLDAASDPRDRAFAALGLFLFLRGSEAAALRVRDLDLNEGTIGVTIFKTDDYDRMPICEELERELRQFLLYYQQECGALEPDWYLVPARVQRGFGAHTLNPHNKISRPHDVIKRILGDYGWTDTYWQGMHLLRASGARAWFDELNNNTVDGALRLVQTHLHHSSTQMTERYLGLTADRVRRDEMVLGSAMFPSLRQDSDNVVTLRKASG
jgi:integrase